MHGPDDGYNDDNLEITEPDILSSPKNNLNTETMPLNTKPDSSSYPYLITRQTSVSSPTTDSRTSLPDSATYDDQVSNDPSEFEKASILNRSHFIFAIKQIWRLRKKKPDDPIKLEDFNMLGKSEEVSQKILKFEQLFLDYRRRYNRSSLLIPILKLFWQRLLVIQLFVCIGQFSRLLFTFVLRELLFQIKQSNQAEAYRWGLGLLLLIISATHGNHTNFFYGNRLVGQLKPTLIGLLYRKISRLNFYSINRVSIGKIVNIAANDLNSFENNLMMVCYLLFSPVVITGALTFLWREFGLAAVPGIILILSAWPYQAFLSKVANKYVSQKNKVTDERIKLTNEMIEGIRLLKMYSWEMQFSNLIDKAREKELASVMSIKYTEQFAAHFLSKLIPSIGSFAIFLSYGLAGNTLTVEKVYSAIMLTTFLGNSLMKTAMNAMRFIVEARLTFQRIIDILDLEEFDQTLQETQSTPLDASNGVEFSQFNAFWGQKQEAAGSVAQNRGNLVHDGVSYETPTLKDLTFTVKKGTLCAIVGKIGSGKSTALMSFLKEVPKVTGDLRFSGSLAYVEQEIVVFPGNVRSNILFGRPYNETFYNRVVEACCLLDDFQEFPEADMMEVGERGVNLSGGQKARISLARALYSDADIYLLDDPLSAVDTKVAKNLFQNAIRGVLKDKTVLLVTHQVHFAKEAEKIVVLDDGKVKAEGTLDEIIRKDSSIMSIFETEHDKKKAKEFVEKKEDREKEGEDEEEEEEVEEDTVSPPVKYSNQDALAEDLSNKGEDSVITQKGLTDTPLSTKIQPKKLGAGKLIAHETDESGRVGWPIYWYYFKNAGSFLSLFILVVCSAVVEILYVTYTRALGYWAEGKWEQHHAMLLLSVILLTQIGCLICREILFVRSTNRASSALHHKALRRVLRATMEFFDTNPVGRILNRFTNDVGVIDRMLNYVQNDMLDATFYFGTIFVTVWVIVPWMLLPGILLVVFFLFFIRFAKKVIIEGRGIELLARGPIYSVFSTTLSGLVPIRVYNQQQRFLNDFVYLLNRHCRAFNGYLDSSRAFGFYCDLFSGIFSSIGIMLVLSMNVDPSLVGLICCLLLAIADYIQWCMRQILLYILMMASTARIKAYSDLPQEAALVQPHDRKLIENYGWPSRGEVVFNNVHLKYRKDTEHVLRGLTFTVKPGEKIGCVGRTGAGKSSILQALFRMVEIDREAVPDSFIKIDGEDILNIGLHTLRENISIIPQAPFVFMGSVRRNLDPLNKYTDEQIIRALEETNLWTYVNSLPKGLDTEISNSSSIFSVGQKQLVCLARALLQRNKILVLDEATANIDFETDNFIQKKILEKFEDSTVFTIAHRLSTVANYTKVLVMSHGQVVEFDHPYLLLVKNIGDISITNDEGAFASMVLHTGAKHSTVIFEIARNSYFSTSR